MKLERIPEYFTTIIILLISFGLTLYLGQQTGGGNVRNPLMILGVVAFTVIGLTLKQRIWILIPLTTNLTGSLPFLPLPFSVDEMGLLTAFAWFVIFRAVKMVRKKPSYGFMDFILLLNLAILALAYVRNPVGTLALETDRVGGRPYFSTIIALMGFWVLSLTSIDRKTAVIIPVLTLIGSTISAIFGLISFLIPATVPVLGRIYTGITAKAYLAQDVDRNTSSGPLRVSVVAGPGRNLFLALCSWFRPITLINPLRMIRFGLLLFALWMILISGFRSQLAACFLIFLLASFYVGGLSDVLKTAALGFPFLIFIIAGNNVLFELPVNAQRALSILPGNWSDEALRTARESTEWRHVMWKAMLSEDKYISNRWLGDGFGYSRTEFDSMQYANQNKSVGTGQDNFLITGQVHSGPISTIRYVGYVGLLLYLFLLIALARMAHRLILQSKKTPFFPAALFIGIPAVYYPLYFVAVFGSYDSAFPETIIRLGLLKMIAEGVSNYKREEAEAEKEALPTHNPLDLRPQLLGRS